MRGKKTNRRSKQQDNELLGGQELFAALELLEREKKIPQEYMIEKLDAALVGAYRRECNGNDNVRLVFDRENKEVRMFQIKTVVESVDDPITEVSIYEANNLGSYRVGDTCEFEIKPKNFRRLSAQTAKQMIIQAIREAERSSMIREYENKRDEIITVRIRDVEIDPLTGLPGDVIVETLSDTDDGEPKSGADEMITTARLLREEQIQGEIYIPGEMLKVYVTRVSSDPNGQIVTLSRTAPGLVKRLFELEVPEMQTGVVVIKNIAREAGSRTKMSVQSRDENVDAIGACIGQYSSRINAVSAELNGEKIDIIAYSDDPAEYIKAALAPAKIDSVIMLEDTHGCRAYVAEDQLSLAIGKEGQNARLAARLTTYKIDIKITGSDMPSSKSR
ncbi:MAG: transcription termination/antitermination protein NusA [Clostridiales bacterium]|mgnify:CR=1 FL=1|nr:transcription termination/antitermination protein NusA [Clostridiales bacterium]